MCVTHAQDPGLLRGPRQKGEEQQRDRASAAAPPGAHIWGAEGRGAAGKRGFLFLFAEAQHEQKHSWNDDSYAKLELEVKFSGL